MGKYKKVIYIFIGIFSVFLIGIACIFIFFPSEKPMAQKRIEYVAESKVSGDTKFNLDPKYSTLGSSFATNFFSFDKGTIEQQDSLKSVSESEYQPYYEKYGKGVNVNAELIDATVDSQSMHLLTYHVTGNYKGTTQKFVMILKITETGNSLSVQNYSVIEDA